MESAPGAEGASCLSGRPARVIQWGDLVLGFTRVGDRDRLWTWSLGDDAVASAQQFGIPGGLPSSTPTRLSSRPPNRVGIGTTLAEIRSWHAAVYDPVFAFADISLTGANDQPVANDDEALRGVLTIGPTAIDVLLDHGTITWMSMEGGHTVLNGQRSKATTTRRVVISLAVALTVVGCGSDDSAVRAPTEESLIVYQGPGGILMTIRADGTGRADLIPEGASNANHPDWSPDGHQLVFVEHDPDGTTDIWVAAADGTGARQLVDCVAPCEVAEDPAWSPDGTEIAYYTYDSGGPEDLRIADARTGKVIRSIPAGELRTADHPRWSPDGNQITVETGLYASYDSSEPLEQEIGVVDLTETTPTIHIITEPSIEAGYPDWSPGGDLIVFHAGNLDPFAEGGAASDIYVVAPDGTELRRVNQTTAAGTKYALPSWSADGRTILITTIYPHRDFRIARLDSNTGIVVELHDASGLDDRRCPHDRELESRVGLLFDERSQPPVENVIVTSTVPAPIAFTPVHVTVPAALAAS